MGRNYDNEFIYNADETGIMWKSLPEYSYYPKSEKQAFGFKQEMKRVTVMVCRNASGTHKILLMVIGQFKFPRPLKNLRIFLLDIDIKAIHG